MKIEKQLQANEWRMQFFWVLFKLQAAKKVKTLVFSTVILSIR